MAASAKTYNKRELAGMTVDQLEGHLVERVKERDALNDYLATVHTELDAKNSQAAAQHRIERLSDSEKVALFQELKAQGATTSERAGAPGKGN